MAAVLSVLTLVGCAAADGSDDLGEDMPIPNGDGSYSVPESWGVDLGAAEAAAEANPAAPGTINKTPGSETRTAVGPSIYSKNVAYTTAFPFGGSAAGALGTVSWSWGFTPSNPASLTVLLCRNGTTDCTYANTPTGSTNYWYQKATSNVPFYLIFKVTGTGSMSPAYGTTDQLIINRL